MHRRTKQEVLARELCSQYWRGMKHERVQPKYTNFTTRRDYVEAHWTSFEQDAINLITNLGEYND